MSCAGKYMRNICIIGTGDLPKLHNSTGMFVNKLHADFEPLAYSCLEERIYKNIKEDILGIKRINLNFYSQSDIAKHNNRL